MEFIVVGLSTLCGSYTLLSTIQIVYKTYMQQDRVLQNIKWGRNALLSCCCMVFACFLFYEGFWRRWGMMMNWQCFQDIFF